MTDLWVAVVFAGQFVGAFEGTAATWEQCAQLANTRAVVEWCDTTEAGRRWMGPANYEPPPPCQVEVFAGVPSARLFQVGRHVGIRQGDSFCIAPTGEVWRIGPGATGTPGVGW